MTSVLYLVGLGLSPRYLTREALETLRRVDIVFMETYTTPGHAWTPEELGRIIGRMPVALSRRDLEERGGKLILEELGRGRSVALAVAGDPMIATTHNALRLEAVRRGFTTRMIYGVSAHCAAISASGLFAYKFGKSATIVYPREGILSVYPYHVLRENLERGLHTLFYLDVRENGDGMSIREALGLLEEMERSEGLGIVRRDRLFIGLARLGSHEERIVSGTLEALKEYGDLPAPPHMLIAPGPMHFMEEEAVKVYLVGGSGEQR